MIGFHRYPAIEKLHSKALRFYLGTGKTAPLCGLRSEMSWPEPRSRTQARMFGYYLHLRDLPDDRITKKVFLFDQNFSQKHTNQMCWSSEIKQIMDRNNLLLVSRALAHKDLKMLLKNSLLTHDIRKFKQDCSNSSMLRTYNTLLSPFVDHSSVTKYVKFNLPFIVRKRLCQLRLGCLPLKIQTDRYIKPRIPPSERYCCQPECISSSPTRFVEDEVHFLCICKQYDNLRNDLYTKVDFPMFSTMTIHNKFNLLLTHPPLAKIVGQFIVDAFDTRLK